jgi:NAD(P)-dependent dehydrogenase (short-subunit alcohol dehydrogenase family)
VNVDGKVAIVTGGASGIGAALSRRLAAGGARVVVADLSGDGAEAVAAAIGEAAVAARADVSRTENIGELISLAESAFGPVDMFFANAGIGGPLGLGEDEGEWEQALEVNLLAHVRAARLLLPGWLQRGSGYFVSTASAAGLLTQIGAAPYAVTKHGAVAFAEWLSLTYGDRGVRVSCLCPMGVDTGLLAGASLADEETPLALRVVLSGGEVLTAESVADQVVDALAEETFLILPHPEVLGYLQGKYRDYDRWFDSMRRLQASFD